MERNGEYFMFITALAACAALITIDQVTKYLAVQFLRPLESVELIPGIFNLTYVENEGAAFGLFQGARWFFVILGVFVLGVIVYYYTQLPNKKKYNTARLSLILIASGAIGNLIDRFRVGYVVDFFHADIIDFPVFNVADTFVVVGSFIMVFLILFVFNEKKSRKSSVENKEPQGVVDENIDGV
jgi:signal peptidase II